MTARTQQSVEEQLIERLMERLTTRVEKVMEAWKQSSEEQGLPAEQFTTYTTQLSTVSTSQDQEAEQEAAAADQRQFKYQRARSPEPEYEGDMFTESTHKYLVYFALEPSGGRVNGIIIALFVLALQFSLFCLIFQQGVVLVNYEFYNAGIPVVASIDSCKAFEYQRRANGLKVESDIFLLNSGAIEDGGVRCANDPNTLKYQLQEGVAELLLYIGTACLLMACFLLEDVLSCFKLLLTKTGKWAKFSALLILILNAFAFVAGIFFALAGVLSGSPYDALLNCVGVLFVHDIDEKVFAAMAIINQTEMEDWRCCRRYCRRYMYAPVTCTICWLVLMLGIGLSIAGIILFVDKLGSDGKYGLSSDDIDTYEGYSDVSYYDYFGCNYGEGCGEWYYEY